MWDWKHGLLFKVARLSADFSYFELSQISAVWDKIMFYALCLP